LRQMGRVEVRRTQPEPFLQLPQGVRLVPIHCDLLESSAVQALIAWDESDVVALPADPACARITQRRALHWADGTVPPASWRAAPGRLLRLAPSLQPAFRRAVGRRFMPIISSGRLPVRRDSAPAAPAPCARRRPPAAPAPLAAGSSAAAT